MRLRFLEDICGVVCILGIFSSGQEFRLLMLTDRRRWKEPLLVSPEAAMSDILHHSVLRIVKHSSLSHKLAALSKQFSVQSARPACATAQLLPNTRGFWIMTLVVILALGFIDSKRLRL